jgi:N-acetylglucosamine kinase-like BadF-type ATPase
MGYINLQVTSMVRVALRANRYVVGVDGGATKTIALIGTEDGTILGRGRSGSSNYHNVGSAAASRAIKHAVTEARKLAGIGTSKVEVAAVALAGLDSPRDEANALRFVRNIKIAHRTLVIHDTLAYLRAATHGRPGIVVNSGTGSVAAGINKAGDYARAGGWGYLVDDEGSAYDIGMKALRSAFRMIDGRQPKTKLMSKLTRNLRLGRLENVLSTIYSGKLGVDGIAALSPLVSASATNDKVCREILNKAGVTLAELACVVAKRLGMTHDVFPIVLVGGTYKSGRHLLQPLKARVRKECPRARVKIMKVEPALGAFSIAVSELGKRN